MRKILVAFDGSGNSLRALGYALSVARADGGSLHVVYAHEPPDLYGDIAAYVSPEKMLELQRHHGETVLRAARAVLQDAGVPFETEVLIGGVAASVAGRADELGCDSIVMGTRGMTSLAGLIIGSVATKIVHAANLPVTLVK